MAVDEPLPGSKKLHDLSIQVLGTTFSITTAEDPQYLDEVLTQYQLAIANTEIISGMKEPLKVAVLTGFLLCDEINKLKLQIKNEQASAEKELNRIARNLIASIDKVIVTDIEAGKNKTGR
jgi:cell division protein ZapA (FtsZ GTPase activity inhibitor)